MPLAEATSTSVQAAETRFVAVRVGTLRLVVALADTVEVVRMVETTPVPDAGEPVLGVVDYRGVVIPAIDPAARLGQARRAPSSSSKLVIVQCGERLIAVMVDEVEGLVDLDMGRLAAHEALFPGERPAEPCTQGTVRLDDGLALVLDVKGLLGAARA